jgi:hypothetical protein
MTDSLTHAIQLVEDAQAKLAEAASVLRDANDHDELANPPCLSPRSGALAAEENR